ncbi:hypothetical protein LTR10_020095 [Elasticomyces elasticus]|uniref:Xylanolytic transcriptional activator regulatory domain-containing protein n=1 Tax=Exophiala sideris TaxID=1016849 RepID=A0ABR0IVS9_9EURO|nr:hypothetical protein LTR10_020095 [Elasticomyces elasticus]KAK5021323.1 hypothetical protein LTS07_011066 [Exophiala sideris]KAK5024271.1 hypothetical protein LTR13_010892 [Exophiala sideris]KAK5049214.1 hypothetical protein LTR69_011089 [Exophiala sideris]KAK5176526.1 hypothetical protein LTR44_010914 [Eurotiomycetes sp. CCFEE 6388]
MGAWNGTPIPAQADVSTGTSAHTIRPDSNGASGDPTDLAPPVAGSPGYLEYTSTAVNYVGNSHWLSILGKIPDLKDIVKEFAQKRGAEDVMDNSMPGMPDLLSEINPKIDRREILNAIPSRSVVDTLFAEFFINTDSEIMLVHPPTFRKEYVRFWEDPSSMPIMWIGQLFAFMCLAIQYQQFSPVEARRLQLANSGPEHLIESFHAKTAQCLCLGGYTDGPPYTVETLLLHFFAKVLRANNTETNNSSWALWGLIIRIAMRTGYHRDGSHFPTIPPFQAEMRRRVWAMIVQWDMFLALQFALPRMIVPSQCDTADPRNLTEDDLDSNMLELPPARPPSAKTNAQFHVDKNRLIEVIAEVADMSSSLRPPPHTEIWRLDELLNNTYESIAPIWQPEPLPADATRASVGVRTIFLATLYLRAQIVLHQRYMVVGRTIPQYARSRKIGIEAALTLLQHQWTLYLETQVGGPLCRHGWKFLTLLNPDFLFATAILCAELAQDLTSSVSLSDTKSEGDRIFHSLSSAYIVWLHSNDADSTRAVKTVVAALRELLGKAQTAGFGTTRAGPQLSSTGKHGEPRQPEAIADPFFGLGQRSEPVPGTVYHGIANFPI